MKGQYLILIVGHNGSGKTTLSSEIVKTFGINRVSNDDIRELLTTKIAYFSDTDYSYPNDKNRAMTNVAHEYQKALTKELLMHGETVFLDGGGFVRERRERNLAFAQYAPGDITTVIIEFIINEDELLKRLSKRDEENPGHRWVEHYYLKKDKYEPVADDEADYVLGFDHNNNDEIIEKLKEILK